MEANPKAPNIVISLDRIQDPVIRDAFRNLSRQLEVVYNSVSKVVNFNLARQVIQDGPDIPHVEDGESILWKRTDVDPDEFFVVSRIGNKISLWAATTVTDAPIVEEGEEPPVVVEPPPEPDPAPPPPANYFFFSSWEEGDERGATKADGTYDPVYWPGDHSAGDDRIQVLDKSVLPGGVGTHGDKVIFFQVKDGDFIKTTSWHRSEISLGQTNSDGFPGRNQWWAYSLYIPADYVFPQQEWHNSLHGQFHSVRSTGQPHWVMEIARESEGGVLIPMWRQRINAQGGEVGPRTYPRGRVAVERGHWYDFTMNIKWTHDNTGFQKTWMRRRDEAVQALVQNRTGIQTLYDTYGVYFKIGSYHPAYAGGNVYYDRVVMGYTPESVAICPLEGV